MKPDMKGKIKLAGICFVVGAIITMLIGFALGGWKTAGMVKKMNEKAVVTNHVEICAAQFVNDPNYNANLEEFKKLGDRERGEFITKSGWDKMPGQKEADADVAKECAWKIEDIMRK